MEELKEKYGAQLTVMFQPIDFSNILGFPNYCNGLQDAYKWIPIFHGSYGDSSIWHVKSFLQLIADSNILHEDNMMEMFAGTFWGEACCWFYQGLPNKCITSFPSFLCMLLDQWHYGRDSMNGLKKFHENIFTFYLSRIEYHMETYYGPFAMIQSIEDLESLLEHFSEEEIHDTTIGELPRVIIDNVEYVEVPPSYLRKEEINQLTKEYEISLNT